MLLVALAVEGFTVIDVRQMIVVHLFVGLLLVPVTVLKLGSTGWRFWHYYRGEPAYRRKGPPHPVLRILAPLVVLATIALLGTGVTLLIVGPANGDSVRNIHQASFVVWVVLMTVHVFGHLLETGRLASKDWRRPAAQAVPRASARRGLVTASLVLGVALGLGSLGWNGAWKHRADRRQDGHRRPVATTVAPTP